MRDVLNTSMHGFLHEPSNRNGADETPEQRAAFFEDIWNSPGFSKLTTNYMDLLFDKQINAEWCDFIAAKVQSIVKDPVTADRLIPKDHSFGEKRPPFIAGYYETYNRPNVSLVSLRETPIVRITETGIETEDGEQPFDVIIWATGFDFGTGALSRMGIVGQDGLALTEHWEDGPVTFLGIQTAGFPNFFFPGGPHAAAGNNPRYNGDQADFVADTLVWLRQNDRTVIEVTPEAEQRWCDAIEKSIAFQPFTEKSYYFGTNVPGKPRRFLLNSAGRPKLLKEVARVKDNNYEAFTTR
jgi:cation diffusion facilitator CzcD-associated flavoprotein CzcO